MQGDKPTSKPDKVRDGRNGAYIGQRRHRRGVPRADVRAERRRLVERLRADQRSKRLISINVCLYRQYIYVCLCK